MSERQAAGRRPQWRGERRALLVRLPKAVAAEVEERAADSCCSLSDAAGSLIQAGLQTMSTPREGTP